MPNDFDARIGIMPFLCEFVSDMFFRGSERRTCPPKRYDGSVAELAKVILDCVAIGGTSVACFSESDNVRQGRDRHESNRDISEGLGASAQTRHTLFKKITITMRSPSFAKSLWRTTR